MRICFFGDSFVDGTGEGRLVFSFGLNDLAPDDEFGRPRVSEGASLQNAHDILSEASAWRPTLMMGPLPVRRPLLRRGPIRCGGL